MYWVLVEITATGTMGDEVTSTNPYAYGKGTGVDLLTKAKHLFVL